MRAQTILHVQASEFLSVMYWQQNKMIAETTGIHLYNWTSGNPLL